MIDEDETGGHDAQLESATAVFIFTSLLLTTLVISYFIQQRKIRVLHESLIATTLGIITGMIIHYTGDENMQRLVTFDHRYFFNLLLPPIILKSGYDLEVGHFFANMGIILTFAFVGTFISALIIGLLLYIVIVLMQIGNVSMTFLQCLMFGSILSSTDPVTVLAIFNQVKVDPNLYAFIFGESMLNDAVSIVFYKVLDDLQQETEITAHLIWNGFLQFIFVFLGSTFVGVLMSILTALILKHTQLFRYPALESSIVILLAYMTYLLSNTIELTGIVSLLFCGMTMKHYVLPNLSSPSQKTTLYMFHVMAHLCENFIFIYLGVSIFTQTGNAFRWGLIICTFIFILLGRAVSVFPLAKMINFFSTFSWCSGQFSFFGYSPLRSDTHGLLQQPQSPQIVAETKQPIPMNYQIMLWWAGLRGAIAFALSMSINAESLNEVKTTTLIVVILSIFILGGTTPLAIKHFNIELPPEQSLPEFNNTNSANRRSSTLSSSSETPLSGSNENIVARRYPQHWFLAFDRKYLMPLLIRRNNTVL